MVIDTPISGAYELKSSMLDEPGSEWVGCHPDALSSLKLELDVHRIHLVDPRG